MLLITSLLVTLFSLLGIAWIATHGSLLTVDGLFMSLILLSICGMFAANGLMDFRRRRRAGSAPAAARRAPGAAADASGMVQKGKIEKVEFFESHVGQPNKSIVTLSNSTAAFHMLVFEGDMRNALPTGQKVEITFRRANGYNVLLGVSYS
jgi:hypothetical protein